MSKVSLFENINEQTTKEEIDDYEYTCQTMIAFENIIQHNLNGVCQQGKKMTTSSSNEINPNAQVTPDLIIEIPEDKGGYRAINEVKVNLPRNQEHWIDTARQIKKYDDDLTGWKYNSKVTHDLFLTTNALRVRDFTDYMNSLSQNDTISIERNFAILESTRMEQEKTFIMIRKDSGTIGNEFLNTELHRGIGVNRDRILREISQMKFYDSEPPVLYTMMIIWDHIVKSFQDFRVFREKRRNQIIQIRCSKDDILNKLRRFAPSNPNCIKKEWVSKALQGFEELDLAFKINNEDYDVYLKKHKGSTRDFFFKLIKERPSTISQSEVSQISQTTITGELAASTRRQLPSPDQDLSSDTRMDEYF